MLARGLRGLVGLAALILASIAAAPAPHAEMRYEAAFPETPMKGATDAAGEFVWSHGAGGTVPG